MWKQITRHLSFYVLIAIIAGILLGHYAPATAVKMEIIGKSFVDIIKLFIAPIIFLTIVQGISGMGSLKKVGRIGIKSLVYFEVVTTLALAIGIAVALLIKPGLLDKTGLPLQDASKYTGARSSHFSWIGWQPLLRVLYSIIRGTGLPLSDCFKPYRDTFSAPSNMSCTSRHSALSEVWHLPLANLV
jgi:Na+/H+-dicarboxylate symporter